MLLTKLHHPTRLAAARLGRVLRALDLGNHELKGLGDVLVVARAGLGEGAAELRAQLPPFVRRHLPLLGPQVALVADDDEGDGFGALV